MTAAEQWTSIVGNQAAVDQVRDSLFNGRVVHAYLLIGPEGVGKTLTANLMARALLCEADAPPCGQCVSCRQFTEQNHPDFFLVVPDGISIKIDQIRTLQEKIALAPYLSKRRVILLDDADKMTAQSANALLKTLEEPPGEVVFLLVAANRRALLDTIVSRTAVISFQPIQAVEIEQFLQARAVAPSQAQAIARLSQGSIAKALQYIEEDGLFFRNKAAELLKPYDLEQLFQSGDLLGALERMQLLALLAHLETLLRDLLIFHDDEEKQLICNVDLEDLLANLVNHWPPGRIFSVLKRLGETRKAVAANANAKLTMEAFLVAIQSGERLI